MGYFDREVRNGLDRMFDYNRDGVLNPMEETMQFGYLSDVERELDGDVGGDGFDLGGDGGFDSGFDSGFGGGFDSGFGD